MALTLPQMDCKPLSYLRTMAVPAVATLGCIALYGGINRLTSPGDWAQILLGGVLGVLAIAVSLAVQFRPLAAEIKSLRQIVEPS